MKSKRKKMKISKKILVISASLKTDSNSDMLAELKAFGKNIV